MELPCQRKGNKVIVDIPEDYVLGTLEYQGSMAIGWVNIWFNQNHCIEHVLSLDTYRVTLQDTCLHRGEGRVPVPLTMTVCFDEPIDDVKFFAKFDPNAPAQSTLQAHYRHTFMTLPNTIYLVPDAISLRVEEIPNGYVAIETREVPVL